MQGHLGRSDGGTGLLVEHEDQGSGSPPAGTDSRFIRSGEPTGRSSPASARTAWSRSALPPSPCQRSHAVRTSSPGLV